MLSVIPCTLSHGALRVSCVFAGDKYVSFAVCTYLAIPSRTEPVLNVWLSALDIVLV